MWVEIARVVGAPQVDREDGRAHLLQALDRDPALGLESTADGIAQGQDRPHPVALGELVGATPDAVPQVARAALADPAVQRAADQIGLVAPGREQVLLLEREDLDGLLPRRHVVRERADRRPKPREPREDARARVERHDDRQDGLDDLESIGPRLDDGGERGRGRLARPPGHLQLDLGARAVDQSELHVVLPLGLQREAQGVLAFGHGQRVPVDILAPGDLAVRGRVGLEGRGLIGRIAHVRCDGGRLERGRGDQQLVDAPWARLSPLPQDRAVRLVRRALEHPDGSRHLPGAGGVR